jgi:TonB family protein
MLVLALVLPLLSIASDPPLTFGSQAIERVGGDVSEPVEISRVSPDYSVAARKDRLEGRVILEAIITATGAVADVRVLRSVHPLLDDASVAAVRQWRYEPGRKKGVPVPVYLTVSCSFAIPSPTPAPRPDGSLVGNWRMPGKREWLSISPEKQAYGCRIGSDDSVATSFGTVAKGRITWQRHWPEVAVSRFGAHLRTTGSEGERIYHPVDDYMASSCWPSTSR